jgi:GNAT superfamily N-acetyltransferase
MKVEICKVCDVLYCPDLATDRMHHNRIHDLVVAGVGTSVAFRRVLTWITPGDQVTVISHNRSLPEEKKVAEEVAWVAKRSIGRHAGFSWPRYLADTPVDEALDYHIFLYLRKARAIGMLAVCRRYAAAPVIWSTNTQGNTIEHSCWCIQMVWTAHNLRKAGIAKTLVRQAAAYIALPDVANFAWSAPFTESGAGLIKELCPVEFWVA